MQRNRSAFTLIELAVVLVVIAVSITAVLPTLNNGVLERVRLRSSTKRIASVAEYTHQQAACKQLTHLLHLDTEEGTYWVTCQAPDGQPGRITQGMQLKGRLPECVRFMRIELAGMNMFSQDAVTIEFDPQGWADPATIYLASSKGETMSVVIDGLSGQVRVCELE